MASLDFPKLDKVRFFVVDDDGRPVSSAWFMDCRGSAVHAAPRDIAGGCKLILDPPGASMDGRDSQFGLASLHIEDQPSTVAWRRPLRWRRPSTPEAGAVRVAAIVFPSELDGPARPVPKDGRRHFELPRAAHHQAVEVSLFYSRDLPHGLVAKFQSLHFTPLFYLALPNGDHVSVTARHMSYARDLTRLMEDHPDRAWRLGIGSRWGDDAAQRTVVLVDPPGDDDAIVLADVAAPTQA